MQEFSVVEHYAAWWNFEDNMRFTEEMFDYIFQDLHLEKKRKVDLNTLKSIKKLNIPVNIY